MDLISTAGCSLLLGGGLGNLIDRLARGSVIDFISLGKGHLQTGIFNVADVAIVVGVSILAVQPYLEKQRNSKAS